MPYTNAIYKYRQFVRRAKQTRVEQIILSRIRPVMGSRGQGYRNCQRMAVKMLVQQLWREDEVVFVDLWRCFVWKADMYMGEGLPLIGKGAAMFASDSGIGSQQILLVANIV